MSTVRVGQMESPSPDGMARISDDEFHWLRDLIHAHTGIALSEHKRALLCSRLGKRLRHYGFDRFADYYHLLTERDPGGAELVEMINAITTNKTDFFRESHHFHFLETHLFPRVRQQRPVRMRLWSAGTATGEEAYTLAMTVRAAFPSESYGDIRILATDIDTRVLDHAARGVYTLDQSSRVPSALLHRFFMRGQGVNAGYVKAKPELQELIRFRHLNLMHNPWPVHGPFDAIFCRNVIIYFDRATQQRLIARLTRLLRPDGYLILGHSESVHDPDMGLRHVGQSIYQFTGSHETSR